MKFNPKTLNISAYQFVPLADTAELRGSIFGAAQALKLRGTVLLADEGINAFLAGSPGAIYGFVRWLKRDPRFKGIAVKYSESDSVPFKKLLVKIKREIIRMDHPQIAPSQGRAAFVTALTLERWLGTGQDDSGRPLVLLDTRNAFEVDLGTFASPLARTLDLRIDKFTDFPQAVQAAKGALEGKTVVTFCTGGIRCEKAALYMQELGISNVVQLEGGILKYFEDVGHAHYQGSCFVFDERRAVDSDLLPSAPI